MIVLVIGSFLVGQHFGGADQGTVTKTETIRIPVTDIVTQTVQPKPVEVLSQACRDVIAAGIQQQEGHRKLSVTLAKLSEIIDDTGKVVYTSDPNEVVRLSQRWMQLQRDQSDAWNLIGSADADMTRATPSATSASSWWSAPAA